MVVQLGIMDGLRIGLALIAGIVVGAVFLWLSARIFTMRDKSFITPLIIVAIAGAVGFVLNLIPRVNYISWLVVIVLTVLLIKMKYNKDWGKTALVWLVFTVLSLEALLILLLIIMPLFMTAGGMVR